MDLAQLKRMAAREGIPQAIVEKDYALSVVLSVLSQSPLCAGLVFKGGTAIKKIYFPQARFSEDLDFNAPAITQAKARSEIQGLFEGKELHGIRFTATKHEKTSEGLRVFLKFNSFLQQPQRVRFDFSLRENAFLQPVEKQVVDAYELGGFPLRVLALEEILAEKVHAVFSRTAARDLYDVWFLLENNVRLDPALILKKLDYYHEKPDLPGLSLRLPNFKAKWDEDLRQFLRRVPDFELVFGKVLNRLKKEGL
ncbi:MAG: nucleotidyl transferase AbiEii/AbiGii toxin family protein [Candidatus Micrarchaeota archaeon]